MDLFVGERGDNRRPKVAAARICIENKSVVTAHRNKTSRIDDLDEVLRAIQSVKPETIVVATVLVGTADRVLNIPDHVKKRYSNNMTVFESSVVPRLSVGDRSLWEEHDYAVSLNRLDDPQKTVDAFRQRFPIRGPGQTHASGYDYLLVIPVFINNVDPPRVDRQNSLGIDVDSEYQAMLETICRAYRARWHV